MLIILYIINCKHPPPPEQAFLYISHSTVLNLMPLGTSERQPPHPQDDSMAFNS